MNDLPLVTVARDDSFLLKLPISDSDLLVVNRTTPDDRVATFLDRYSAGGVTEDLAVLHHPLGPGDHYRELFTVMEIAAACTL